MDEDLRKLERAAEDGDPRAALRLERERRRAGKGSALEPLAGWLVALGGGTVGDALPVRPGRRWVGTDPGCALVLQDAGVAPRHLEVSCEPGDEGLVTRIEAGEGAVRLLGVDAAGGASPPPLVDGDVVLLGGELRLLFRSLDVPASPTRRAAGPAALPAPSMWVAMGLPMPVALPGVFGAGIPLGARRLPFAWLAVLSGKDRWDSVPLYGGTTEVGAQAEADVRLREDEAGDGRLSVACELSMYRPPWVSVLDPGQRTDPFTFLTPAGAAQVRDGDDLRCGEVRLRFRSLYPELPPAARTRLRLVSPADAPGAPVVLLPPNPHYRLDPWRGARAARDRASEIPLPVGPDLGQELIAAFRYDWDRGCWWIDHGGHRSTIRVGRERTPLVGSAMLRDGDWVVFEGPPAGDAPTEVVFVLEPDEER
jgi:hypothetical protein